MFPTYKSATLVSGTFDYLVKARLGGMDEYRSLLPRWWAVRTWPARSGQTASTAG